MYSPIDKFEDAPMHGSNDFARAFGNALFGFLEENRITQSEAAVRLGLDKAGKARINTYCHDSRKGRRPKPSAEVLCLVCAVLGFSFDYKGYRISAATLNGGPRMAGKESAQLPLDFESQFNLTNEKGTVSVSVRQPPGRIAVSFSLKTAL